MGLGLAISHEAARNLQFLGDIEHLLRRHKVPCGQPADLESLAGCLVASSALQGDLFNLCTAISHMAAEDLPAEALLLLVSRAVGGTNLRETDVPPQTRSAFLTCHAQWIELQPLYRSAAEEFVQQTPGSAQSMPDFAAPICASLAARGTLLPFSRAAGMNDGKLPVEQPFTAAPRRLREQRIWAVSAVLLIGSFTSIVAYRHNHFVAEQAAAAPMPKLAVSLPTAPHLVPAAAPRASAPSPASVHRTVVVSSSTLLRAYALSTPAPVFARSHDALPANVDVQITIASNGRVRDAHVLRGDSTMSRVALRTLRGWRFKPYLVNGAPVQVIAAFDFGNGTAPGVRPR